MQIKYENKWEIDTETSGKIVAVVVKSMDRLLSHEVHFMTELVNGIYKVDTFYP